MGLGQAGLKDIVQDLYPEHCTYKIGKEGYRDWERGERMGVILERKNGVSW